jgi:hypothetical protein
MTFCFPSLFTSFDEPAARSDGYHQSFQADPPAYKHISKHIIGESIAL